MMHYKNWIVPYPVKKKKKVSENKKLPTKETLGTDKFRGNLLQTFKEKITLTLLNF